MLLDLETLDEELIPAFEKQRELTKQALSDYHQSYKELRDHARLISRCLTRAIRQRTFYPGRPKARHAFWEQDDLVDDF